MAAYPSTFDPNDKTQNPRRDGVPQFDPNVKAGGSFTAKIPVPEAIRVSGSSPSDSNQKPKSVTWIIEVTSQIIFSSSASVNFELLISRDERSLEYNFAVSKAVGSHGHGEPGRVHDHQQGNKQRHSGHRSAQAKGVYSKAIELVVDDVASLWNKPELPQWEQSHTTGRVSGGTRSRSSSDKPKPERKKKKKKQKIHLVILTHGLHSNLSADMLYLKESIDATAKHARAQARNRRKDASMSAGAAGKQSRKGDQPKSPSTAPLSGGQEDLHEGDAESGSDSEDDDEEEIIVRGFNGNAVRTESGIQYLGKRLAKWILEMTYPDQPYKPLHRSMSKKLSDALSTKPSQDSDHGVPTHPGSTIRSEDPRANDLAYTFTSISFVGHSLGGLIQLYAIGYIQKHAPHFFDQVEPINFITMASPLLGLSNENPMYVKFALDFGLVGRTGQDLGLTWRPPTLAKSGWTAMMGGLGASQKDQPQEDPGAKPLLRILPTGPAHRVLRMFRNRTVYSNVVNDGIVPLRTSCLLFLDWRGLGRVEKARRENGLIGTMVGWGWAEITGQSASPNTSMLAINSDSESQNDADQSGDALVPQPSAEALKDNETQSSVTSSAEHQFLNVPNQDQSRANSTSEQPHQGVLEGLWSFIRPSGKTTKKDMRMFSRSQTIKADEDNAGSESTQQRESSPEPSGTTGRTPKRPPATRGDSILDDPTNALAPPKTTIFESAGDILNAPIPPTSWIIDPASRTRTIFHDRVYHPEDIPPPPSKRPTRRSRSVSPNAVSKTDDSQPSTQRGLPESPDADTSTMRVEEKIARAYHKDLSWRKVLVRLEPDAHNNMIVRRMFANAYGWPVIKHLCDTHFGDTHAAATRDEHEPATDRAMGIHKPVGEQGEHVRGQEDVEPPECPASEMREAADELAPLRTPPGDTNSRPNTALTPPKPGSSLDSWDDVYYQDTTDEEDSRGGPIQRFWAPPLTKDQKASPASRNSTLSTSTSKQPEEHTGTSQAEIADFLTAPPLLMEGHRGLEPLPTQPGRSSTELGLRRTAESMVGESANMGVEERVARSLSKGEDAKPNDTT